MINIRVLETNKFEDEGSMILIQKNQGNGTDNHVKSLGVFLKRWINSLKRNNKKKRTYDNILRISDEKLKPIWLEENITKYQRKDIKKTKIKENIIFNKINYIHPVFQTHTHILRDFVNQSKLKNNQTSIEIESIDLVKIGQLLVKNKLVINPINETIEIITNVKVKKLTLF